MREERQNGSWPQTIPWTISFDFYNLDSEWIITASRLKICLA